MLFSFSSMCFSQLLQHDELRSCQFYPSFLQRNCCLVHWWVPLVGFPDCAEAQTRWKFNCPGPETPHLCKCGCLGILRCWAPEPLKYQSRRVGVEMTLDRRYAFWWDSSHASVWFKRFHTWFAYLKIHQFLIHTKHALLHMGHLPYCLWMFVRS